MMKRFLLLGAWLLSAVCALQAATTEYPLSAPLVNPNYEIKVNCDLAKGNVSTSGMTSFSESQLYHISGEDIIFDALDFTLSATPAKGYEFLGWVDVTNMVKSDDPDLNTPEKVIAMMQESLDDGMQVTDPCYSVYTALLNADAKFTSESFYDYLFLYEPEDGHITFTAFFVKGTQDVEQVLGDQVPSTKECRDGVLYIVRDGKIYTAQGARVK